MDAEPTFNEAAMSQLSAMGFSEIRCKKALLATGNADADAAMEWLFAHMEDPGGLTKCHLHPEERTLIYCPDIDDPLPSNTRGSSGGAEPSSDQIAMLSEMGFTSAQARKALRETV